jgi:hypothetical protein
MDHGQALVTKASERYLLGEMNEPERFDFEGHYFTCDACAEDVRVGVALVRGIKAVCATDETASSKHAAVEQTKPKRGWFSWLSTSMLAPCAASLVLAVVAGYQGLVVIPSLRETAAPQALESVVLRPAARGEEPAVQVTRKGGVSILAMDVNSGEPGHKITYELTPPAGASGITGSAQVPPAGTQLLLVLANATFQQPGAWTLILRTTDGAEMGRYPFRIETK